MPDSRLMAVYVEVETIKAMPLFIKYPPGYPVTYVLEAGLRQSCRTKNENHCRRKGMNKKKALTKTAAAVMACCMLGSTVFSGAGMGVVRAEGEGDSEWNEIQSIVSRYYGEWNDTTYPGTNFKLHTRYSFAGKRRHWCQFRRRFKDKDILYLKG